jgi:formylmethanofuran dehydrogenase subunit E
MDDYEKFVEKLKNNGKFDKAESGWCIIGVDRENYSISDFGGASFGKCDKCGHVTHCAYDKEENHQKICQKCAFKFQPSRMKKVYEYGKWSYDKFGA